MMVVAVACMELLLGDVRTRIQTCSNQHSTTNTLCMHQHANARCAVPHLLLQLLIARAACLVRRYERLDANGPFRQRQRALHEPPGACVLYCGVHISGLCKHDCCRALQGQVDGCASARQADE